MSSTYFQFKQFTVFHDKCAMKVGADGVTLGAWAEISGVGNILDVGCGSGLIALMLAQRCNANITAIDIDGLSVAQTIENITNSRLHNRITVFHVSFQEFAQSVSEKFDVIVSNPPFFINSLKNLVESRTLARHNDMLSHEDLILNAKKMMCTNGKLCLILPVNEGAKFIESAKHKGLFCSKKVTLYPNYQKPAKRLLLEFRKTNNGCEESELIIEKERNIYTPEYTELVKDFYLKISS